jgi:hypothetical protein
MRFDGADGDGYDAGLYRELLEYARSRYRNAAWFALPRDVAVHIAQQRN